MKKRFILAAVLLIGPSAYAVQYVYDVLVTQGIVSTGTIGSAGVGRGDAQLELRNNGYGHALMSTVLMQNPGNTVNENAWSGAAYGGSGTLVQQGAFYMKWGDTNETNGYSCLGIHPNHFLNRGIYSDVMFDVCGQHGIAMFNGASNPRPSDDYLLINRKSGIPSIVGNSDVVIDSNYGGSPDAVYLQAYNSGNVAMVLGGGNVGIGAYQAGTGGQYNVVMKNGTCPSISPNGTGTICVDSAGNLRFVGQNGTTTILAKP